jgi:IS5 family transposase
LSHEKLSLATTGFELFTKRTRKREFLDEMNLVISWSHLLALITPHAPVPCSTMKRIPTHTQPR